MIAVFTGTRTFGELEYDRYVAKKLKKGTGKLDPVAVMCVTSMLDGLWTWATMGYMVTDLFGMKVVVGDCPTGLDRIVYDWARCAPTHSYEKFPEDDDPTKYPDMPPFHCERKIANWKAFGKPAGPYRNTDMLDYAEDVRQPDEELIVVGVFDVPEEESKGTRNCIGQAEDRKLPVARLKYYERI